MSVRVIIVDDSPFVRQVLRDVLSRYPDIEVVGEAADGDRAERLVIERKPDVVTMDVVMPLVGGMEAIRSIMRRCPTPIVVVADAHRDHHDIAMQAIAAGAIDALPKPRSGFDQASADALVTALRSAAQVNVRWRSHRSRPPRQRSYVLIQRLSQARCIGIVASTGGPQTLRTILMRLHRCDFPPVVVVQHTSIGFTQALVAWLATETRVRISIARDGRSLRRRTVVVAPDDTHLEIDGGGVMRLHQRPQAGNHRPSGTLLLRSLAHAYGADAVGVVLTGMGDDGADGAHAVETRGGLVLVEDPALAILDGMPRAAIERTHAALIVSSSRIGKLCARAFARSEG
ncbi:MAG: chemotaxis response regulator protein-glutamate methylesterase [Haliangiales bacterium]